jgi:hypothetical protein
MRWLLLGTSALVGLGTLATPAGAATVAAGGALDITVSGFVRFLTALGQRDNARLDDTDSSGLDFLTDTEVHFEVAGKHDPSGIEYGGNIELEADTNRTDNADETWLYLEGGWGQVQLGDTDGVSDVDGMSLSAATIAAGTGGLDGDVVDVFADGIATYDPIGTSDATKILYSLSPKTGFQLGLSYTPNVNEVGSGSNSGDSLAAKDVEAGDVAEGAVGYVGSFGGLDLKAMLAGLHGDIKDEDEVGGDEYWAAQGGVVLGAFGFELAGSYLTQEVGGIETDAITLGLATELGRADISLNYGQFLRTDGLTENGNELDQPWTVILSADIGLMPGLVLAADFGYFDNDVEGEVVNADDDNGWQGVTRLGLAF